MKFFVTGVGGQLGHDVMNELLKRGHEGVGSDIQENYSGVADGSAVTKAPYVALDITNKDAVEKVITEVNPDAVIHCAAWTAVDMAEDDDKVSKVRAINAGGTQNIADVCKKLDCKMTYISTDYVFDGQGTEPWKPDCKDYKPLNVYGQTKLEGELAVSQTLEKYFIVRIAWVFGLNGKNFIKTMLNVGKTHDTVRVVNDQIGTPTYTYDLARLLVDMNETEKYGYYHATNEGGYISWYDFTKEIYRQAGYKTEVLPVTTAEYGLSKAARPFNSRLDKSKLVEAGFTPLPTWQDALSRYKIPNILSSVFSVFSVSWQQSATECVNDDDRDRYFSDVYNKMVATLLTLCCGILSLNSWLFNFIFDSKYYAGHLYAPVLIGGTVFATISQFYGSIQISLKQPKENGITTVIGAAANVVIHLALIRFIGLYAAAISTILSEIIVCILRRQRLAKFVTLTLSGQSICYFAVYLVFTGLAYYITNPIVNVVSVIAATIIVVYANKNFILKFVRKLKTK